MQPRLGLGINRCINPHFLLTVSQIGVILSFFLSTALCKDILLVHQHFIGYLGQGHFFLILVNDFVTKTVGWDFFLSLGFLLEEFRVLPCPQHKRGHFYLINSWRNAISLSCSALSIICHALLMSMTSLPSGGT